MKIFRADIAEAIFLILLSWLTTASSVLTGYDGGNRPQLTDDRSFGCKWEGGSTGSALICSCKEDAEEFYIRPLDIQSFDTGRIEIKNCKKVRFASNAIKDFRNLRNIDLENIESLILEDQSFAWTNYASNVDYTEWSLPNLLLKIHIKNCRVSNIGRYAFGGKIFEIIIEDSTLENVDSFAFSSLEYTENLIIKNTLIGHLGMTPFKKITTKNLILDKVVVDEIPSRAFFAITVTQDFIIRNSKIGTLRPRAIDVQGMTKFEVTDNTVLVVDSEAFSVQTKGTEVLFKNNNFGNVNDEAFKEIRPNLDEVFEDVTLIFESNIFSNLSRNALDVSDVKVQLLNFKINEQCDCDRLLERITDFSDYFPEIKCLENNEFVSMQDFKTFKCTIIAGHLTTIIIVGVVFAMCVIVGLAISVYYHRVYKVRKYGSKSANSKNNNLSLIVPDGRTYRETELHVIVERADLLTTDL